MATGTSDPYMYAGNNARKSKWDLPVIINLNARSLSIEKLDELNVTVGIQYMDDSTLFEICEFNSISNLLTLPLNGQTTMT